ncbi:uncharacterized protein [Medicago truncatula]|uniref:uncharacterized protein n=1 Tax=Medicago truncatula TaxID=3880 RepID=UPI001966E5AB|nr:uncharacterized protein LOC120578337 [Medicago truncatula]
MELLFLSCAFASRLWDWIGSRLNRVVDVSSFDSLLSCRPASCSSQVADIFLAAILYTLHTLSVSLRFSPHYTQLRNFEWSLKRRCKVLSDDFMLKRAVSELRVELDREPTWFEIYDKLHRPKAKPDEWFNETQAKIAEMFQTQMFEKHSQSGEISSQQPTEEIDNDIYMEIVGGINKKGRIFGLGSQVVVVKESLRPSPSISTDVASSEKVAAMEAKIEALTAELEKKIFEQETLKQKMERLEQMIGNIVPNMNTSMQQEGEGDNGNN